MRHPLPHLLLGLGLTLHAAPPVEEAPTGLTEPMVAQESPYIPRDPRAEPFLKVEFKPQLNTQIPLDLEFMGDDGLRKPLRDRLLPGKPTLLAIVYYRCPTMCNLVLNGMVDSLREIPLRPGEDFGIVAVSFDTSETHVTAHGKKVNALGMYGDSSPAGWEFLVGDESAVTALTSAARFGFKFDPATNEFSHGTGLLVLTPDGRISRFLPGMDYPINDLRLSLVEAGQGKIGSLTDKLALLCYKYDPVTGRYGLLIHRIILAACSATIASVAWLILGLLRFERRRQHSPGPVTDTPPSP